MTILASDNRAYNFNAGPSALPLDVLEKAQKDLTNFKSTGMSVMELSHRSKTYDDVHNDAIQLLKNLMQIPDNYEVLFLQGGASTQFATIPMNFLNKNNQAAYVNTGAWSTKAFAETKFFGKAYEIASSKSNQFKSIPDIDFSQLSDYDAYLHITSNNTISGTEWQDYPSLDTPLIADMSSDILSRPIDVSKFGMIYAGAQKNLGPSGVTLVIIRDDLLAQANQDIPTMFKYQTHVDKNSLFNTPPTFGIYMLGEVLKWIAQQGGVEAIEVRNQEKANLLYRVIDQSQGFYQGHADKDSRSRMNVTFRLQDETLEKLFLEEAKVNGFVGLNGHRSVGGCRASLYNAVPLESVEALHEFMVKFQTKHQ